MRIDPVIGEHRDKLRQIIALLLNGLDTENNFLPDGEEGQVLTSRGSNLPPFWADLPVDDDEGSPGDEFIDANNIKFGEIIRQVLPDAIAYEDEQNDFTELNIFRTIQVDAINEQQPNSGVQAPEIEAFARYVAG